MYPKCTLDVPFCTLNVPFRISVEISEFSRQTYAASCMQNLAPSCTEVKKIRREKRKVLRNERNSGNQEAKRLLGRRGPEAPPIPFPFPGPLQSRDPLPRRELPCPPKEREANTAAKS
jgi:hypothetical protein